MSVKMTNPLRSVELLCHGNNDTSQVRPISVATFLFSVKLVFCGLSLSMLVKQEIRLMRWLKYVNGGSLKATPLDTPTMREAWFLFHFHIRRKMLSDIKEWIRLPGG